LDSSRSKTRTASCPDCGGEVRVFERVLIGEVLGCARCGAQLEAAGTDPLHLVPLARVEDDDD
jgi:alpha-aminoadipate carrier protein LysW